MVDILGLATEWYERLSFIHAMTAMIKDKSGVEIMNTAYVAASTLCVADWSYEWVYHELLLPQII